MIFLDYNCWKLQVADHFFFWFCVICYILFWVIWLCFESYISFLVHILDFMCIILFNFLAQILGGKGLVREQFRKPRSKRPYSQELLGLTIPLPTLC
jgi:hypothetical protein